MGARDKRHPARFPWDWRRRSRADREIDIVLRDLHRDMSLGVEGEPEVADLLKEAR